MRDGKLGKTWMRLDFWLLFVENSFILYRVEMYKARGKNKVTEEQRKGGGNGWQWRIWHFFFWDLSWVPSSVETIIGTTKR
jgi:hypothetical protein